jgi:hypothetical protein
MKAATIVILVLAAWGQHAGEGTHKEQTAKAKSQRLLELHTDDAASYSNENEFNHDAKHRYRFFRDRIIPEVVDDGSKEVK